MSPKSCNCVKWLFSLYKVVTKNFSQKKKKKKEKVVTCKDQKIQRLRSTLSSEWYSPALAQINKFVREGNKQQEGALPEDDNKGERAYILE